MPALLPFWDEYDVSQAVWPDKKFEFKQPFSINVLHFKVETAQSLPTGV